MNKIKEIRQKNGLTQKELAAKAGIGIRLVQKIENEEVELMECRIKTIRAIADALGKKIDDFL